MSVKSQQSVTVEFTTAHPTTGAPTSGDTTPTGTLFVDGVANAAAVTVTNITTGVYRAAVTLPTLSAGQIVGIRITAVVATVSGTSVVWQDTADTALPSDILTQITGTLEPNVLLALQLLRNKVVTDPATGVMTIYADNGTDVLFTANIYQDVAGTVPFTGTGANRRNRLA